MDGASVPRPVDNGGEGGDDDRSEFRSLIEDGANYADAVRSKNPLREQVEDELAQAAKKIADTTEKRKKRSGSSGARRTDSNQQSKRSRGGGGGGGGGAGGGNGGSHSIEDILSELSSKIQRQPLCVFAKLVAGRSGKYDLASVFNPVGLRRENKVFTVDSCNHVLWAAILKANTELDNICRQLKRPKIDWEEEIVNDGGENTIYDAFVDMAAHYMGTSTAQQSSNGFALRQRYANLLVRKQFRARLAEAVDQYYSGVD
jgi:hypothetical protein